jgi:excisionase family DNA binding protein
MMALAKDLLTPQEVADYLQLPPDTIYRYIREGKLVASRLGRQYRITRKNLDLFLMATSTAGDARMRTFSRERVAAWLEEDQIEEKTREIGQALLQTQGSHSPLR